MTCSACAVLIGLREADRCGVDKGTLYVLDDGNKRVLKLSAG